MRARWISPPIVETETPPANPLLTIEEIRGHLRIAHTEEDDDLTAFAAAAEDFLDGWNGAMRRALVTRDVRVKVCEADYCGRLFAPLSPVQTLESISYYAPEDPNLTTLPSTADYRLIKAPDWAYVEPLPGKSWPSLDARPDALQAVFTCGYGVAADVPATIRQAAKLIVGHLYENREQTTSLRLENLPFGVQALIYPHKLGFAA